MPPEPKGICEACLEEPILYLVFAWNIETRTFRWLCLECFTNSND